MEMHRKITCTFSFGTIIFIIIIAAVVVNTIVIINIIIVIGLIIIVNINIIITIIFLVSLALLLLYSIFFFSLAVMKFAEYNTSTTRCTPINYLENSN